MIVVEVIAPAMTRPLDHGMYDVPLLAFFREPQTRPRYLAGQGRSRLPRAWW